MDLSDPFTVIHGKGRFGRGQPFARGICSRHAPDLRQLHEVQPRGVRAVRVGQGPAGALRRAVQPARHAGNRPRDQAAGKSVALLKKDSLNSNLS